MAPRARFYSDLAAFDKNLADVIEKVTRGNPKARIDKSGAKQILDVLLKDDAISGFDSSNNEAKVMDMLLSLANFDNAALELIASTLQEAIHIKEAHLKGLQPVRPNSTAMTPFLEALGHGNVGKISFASPGSKLSYAPTHYATIKAMMDRGDIKVYQTQLGAFRLNPILGDFEGGSYRTDINRLVINSGFDRLEDTMTIVHETTHAIQDWLDIKSTVRFCEADAYIAGAVAALAIGWKARKGDKSIHAVAAGTPAQMVLAGKAKDPNDKAWRKAYEQVTNAVAITNLYRSKIDAEFPPPETAQPGRTSEVDRFNVDLELIKKKAA